MCSLGLFIELILHDSYVILLHELGKASQGVYEGVVGREGESDLYYLKIEDLSAEVRTCLASDIQCCRRNLRGRNWFTINARRFGSF